MTASIDAMAPTVTAGSIKELSRVSGLLSLRFEERSLHDRRGRPMPFPLDRHFDLDSRPGPRIRRGDGGDRDVPFQQRRPATARGPTDRSEEHTSELQSLTNLVCRLLLEKKKKHQATHARSVPPRR